MNSFDENSLYDKIDMSKLDKESDIVKLMNSLSSNYSKFYSMTNNTYEIEICGCKRVIRIPGPKTEVFINRKREYLLYKNFISKFENSPDIIYINESGLLVTNKLDDKYKSYDGSFRFIGNILDILNKIHSSDLIHNFNLSNNTIKVNLLDELDNYYKLCEGNRDYKNYSEYYNKYIVDYIEDHQYDNLSLCHRDLIYNNILINYDTNDIVLLDWEYSGLLNYLWDFASFISESNLEFNKDYYLDYCINYNDLNRVQLLHWIAIVEFIWSKWSLAKSSTGYNYYDYGQKRYNRFLDIVSKIVG